MLLMFLWLFLLLHLVTDGGVGGVVICCCDYRDTWLCFVVLRVAVPCGVIWLSECFTFVYVSGWVV